ncbi:MAG: hypothetical protein EON58_17460, partial [Alphaproteobacteria bacterium]
MRNTTFDDRLMAAISHHAKKYVDLFRRSLKRNNSYFEQLISDSIYLVDEDSTRPAVYHCVSDMKAIEGRNHFEAHRLVAGETKPSDYQFFSNAMTEAPIPAVGQKWAQPITRSALGNVMIFTFEWDRDGSFLFDQLDRCFPLQNSSQSAYGKLSADLASTYADYDSITVVYSGNRSLHAHIAFRTHLYRREHGDDLTAAAVNAGHRASWEVLLPIVEYHLAYPAGDGPDDGPDASMKTHVQLRRMPNAIRIVNKSDHPLGLSKGESIPQVIVWEDRIQRRSPDVSTLFLTPSRFCEAAISRSRSLSRKSDAHVRHTMTFEQLIHCGDQMRAILLDTPFLFDRFAIEGDRL